MNPSIKQARDSLIESVNRIELVYGLHPSYLYSEFNNTDRAKAWRALIRDMNKYDELMEYRAKMAAPRGE